MPTHKVAAAAIIVTVLSSTAAFAQGDQYPEPLNAQNAVTAHNFIGPYVSSQSSGAYPAFSPSLSIPTLSQPMIAENNGSESGVNPVNSVPRGFDVGTQAYNDQKVLDKWYANQERAKPHYASASAPNTATGYGAPATRLGPPQQGNDLPGG